MKCCSTNFKACLIQDETNANHTTVNSSTITTSASNNKINSGFQFDSGFCQFCGVDVSLYSHEFWCSDREKKNLVERNPFPEI